MSPGPTRAEEFLIGRIRLGRGIRLPEALP